MEAINLELQIVVNKPEGMDHDMLLDKLTEYIYKFQKQGAEIQMVVIVKIDGDNIT